MPFCQKNFSLKKTAEGQIVACPGLPGCESQGETEQAAVATMKDAIPDSLAAIAEAVKGEDVWEVEVAD